MKCIKHKIKINMWLLRKGFYLILLCLSLQSCAPLFSDWTKPEFNDRNFKKIAVVGILDNLEARIAFEKSAVERLKKDGVNAVEGISVCPANMSEEYQKKENLLKLVQDNSLDGVITMALVDTSESTLYQPGDDYTYVSGVGRFENYYYTRYSTIYTPGYYVKFKSYVIEAVLTISRENCMLKRKRSSGAGNLLW